ncbi:hypothetical protein [Deinococcus sedimenti]|uniref:Uncharacterized protein n=1 Tax=Deinococcus sedimenti TaxID=1867090 RepID=A0ABQ2RZH3_9DEIO|nr:hypothetical protein [Deinococcus sedimenti]GGR78787.1 hypothetical protein GCM10008960_01980 [Deinococcus sedimenti]
MRHPLTALRRTPEEVRDIHLSCARPDLRFFSAGACHVLAFAFLERYPRAGFRPRFIRPAAGFHGTHVYVSDGVTAFDGQGYVPEVELLREHRRAFQAAQPGWTAEVEDITVPLAEFCAGNNHRPPWDFPGDVWGRALAYLRTFLAPA